MKIWIVTIILSTVSCKVAKYSQNSATPDIDHNHEHLDLPPLTPCTGCGSNPSLNEFKRNPHGNSLNGAANVQDAGKEFRQYEEEHERSNAVDPPSGRCQPELQLYTFGDLSDSSVIYAPKCTRVNRCSGCCNTNLRSCTATNRTVTNFRVLRKTNSGNDIAFDPVIIPVEEHLSCECECIVKREDCTDKQEYDSDNCRCDCTNTEERSQCKLEHVLKRWDLDTCSCVCREEEQCQTGFGFNSNICKCIEGYVPPAIQGRHVQERRTSFMNRYIYRPYKAVDNQQRYHQDEP